MDAVSKEQEKQQVTPDWNADEAAAADVLIRRLEFPIKTVMANHVDPYIELHLGQPDTTERDIQPLRPNQVIHIHWAEEERIRFAGTISQVGEGVVTIRPTDFLRIAVEGSLIGPSRMIRLEQYSAGSSIEDWWRNYNGPWQFGAASCPPTPGQSIP